MSVLKRYNGSSWEEVGPSITSARFDAIDDMIAEEYDPGSLYAVDDYVVLSDKLYRCTTAIITEEPWTAAHWQEVKLGQDIRELTGNLSNLITTNKTNLVAAINEASTTGGSSEQVNGITNTVEPGSRVTLIGALEGQLIKKIEANIEPIQCLNGQASPYPGGRGKNLCIPTGWEHKAINASGAYYNADNRAMSDYIPVVGGETYVASANSKMYAINFAEFDAEKHWLRQAGSTQVSSYSRAVGSDAVYVRVMYGAVNTSTTLNLNNFVQTYQPQFELGSTATSYALYENCCPIMGWTGTKINRSKSAIAFNNYTFNPNGVYGKYFEDTAVVEMFQQDICNRLTAGTYIYELDLENIGTSASRTFRMNFVDGTKYDFSFATWEGGTGKYTGTVTFPNLSDKKLLNILLYCGQTSGSTPSDAKVVGIRVFPEDYTLTDNPSDTTSVSISWEATAGTVYDGTLTINDDGTADIIATSVAYTPDANDFSTYSNYYCRFSKAIDTFGKIPTIKSRCNYFGLGIIENYMPDNNCWNYKTSGNSVYYTFRSDGLTNNGAASPTTTLDTFKAWINEKALTSQPLTITLELLEPITYHLTSVNQITTLLGTNSIWINCGDITNLEYIEDTKSYIDDGVSNTASVITDNINGVVANFLDGGDKAPIKELIVNIKPAQSFNGYTEPWPKGGGKNIYNPNNLENKQTNSAGNIYDNTKAVITDYIPVTASATYTISANQSIYAFQIVEYDANQTWIKNNNTTNKTSYTATVGSTTAFVRVVINVDNTNDVSTSTFVATYKPQFEAGSSATQYAPYSNICPLTGWTEANIYQTKKNLINSQVIHIIQNGISITNNSDGTIHFQGKATGARFYTYLQNNFNLKIGTYKFSKNLSLESGSISVQLQGFNSSGTVISRYTLGNANTDTTVSITDPAAYYNIFIDITSLTVGTTLDEDLQIQLELGSTTTSYESHQGNITPISWQTQAGTIYVGTLQLKNNGAATLTKKFKGIILDGDENFGVYSDHGFVLTLNDMLSGSSMPGWCDSFPVNTQVGIFGIKLGSNNKTIYFSKMKNISGVTDVDTWKTWLTTHNVTIIYPLAVQESYIINNIEEITTLLGTNNIWADCGDIENLEYVADTKFYIQKLTQPTEDDMIANNNIATNTYFMIGNNLYLSTSAIAQGETIVPGINCTALSLAQALNNLNT